MQEGKKFLSDLKLHSDYLKWIESEQRYETWEDACESIIDGHRRKYNNVNLEEYLQSALEAIKDKKVLASQRNLQYRFEQIEKNNERMYNCFHKDTEFVTINGVRKFSDFKDGDTTTVLTHLANYKKATIKSYGKQKLNKVTFKKGSNSSELYVTKNHRWILLDGTETIKLSVDDRIYRHPATFKDFKYEDANPLERLYWCYGMVYGDGTKIQDKFGNNKYSSIRLCGNDKQFASRFEECGFKTSTNLSLKGDFIAYTGTYLKTSPDPNIDSPELIRAFVSGYLRADGTKNTNIYDEERQYYEYIQSSEQDHINFIRECFPIAGVYIVSETNLTGEETNYGIRPYTIKFRIAQEIARNSVYKVSNIEEDVLEDEVWCLEVEDDKSFILPNGLVTGNCVGVLFNKNDYFQKCFHVLLSGCGLDFSLRKIFVDQLSNLKPRTKGTKTFVIPDSIEGWADSLGVLMSSYFSDNQPFPEYAEYQIKFDYSLIRPKGSYISGGFKAPGPDGLKQSLEKIETLINNWITSRGTKIESILVYDIIMHSADAVLSGGVRRSACSVLIDENDTEMIQAKLGNWRQNNPQRARSNNAIGLFRNGFTYKELKRIIDLNQGDNDISFIFVHDEYEVSNPCREITFRPILEDGRTGFQACNLTEINASACETEEDFYKACINASILGTFQAGYTNFPYLGKDSEEIIKREALLGVSITGWMNNPMLFDARILKIGATFVKITNEKIAKIIGINPAARTTTVEFCGL